eukprot:5374642-Prymnesium_polylepis.1
MSSPDSATRRRKASTAADVVTPDADGLVKLNDFGLTELPDLSDKTTEVKALVLNKNAFQELPDVRFLTRLSLLTINGSRLTDLPAGALPPSLEELELVNNRLASLDPQFLAELGKLWRLELRGNLMTSEELAAGLVFLPQSKKVEVLDISSNRLETVPDEVMAAPSLINLSVSLNPLRVLPPFGKSPSRNSLVRLSLVKCGLCELTPELVALPKLEVLDVARNALTALPPKTGGMLRCLYVSHNQLSALDESYCRLQSLVELDASHNLLTAWPDGLGSASKFERLLLAFNQITELPAAASKAMSADLRELDLAYNAIVSVRGLSIDCQELFLGSNPLASLDGLKRVLSRDVHMPRLRISAVPPLGARCANLQLPGNAITSLSWSDLASCSKQLAKLNLAHNQLSTLPDELGQVAPAQLDHTRAPAGRGPSTLPCPGVPSLKPTACLLTACGTARCRSSKCSRSCCS